MSSALKLIGLLGGIASIVLAVLTYSMEVTVIYEGQVIANAQLMHVQLTRFVIAGAVLLAAAISFTSGVLVDTLKEQTDRIVRDDAA